MSDIEWGPEIAVNGKRPEWLGDEDRFWPIGRSGEPWGNNYRAGEIAAWTHGTENLLSAIRLPADHPYYAKRKATPVDWSKPIEAVHEDGRVVPVWHPRMTALGNRFVEDLGSYNTFREDGVHYTGFGPWRIRNVAKPTLPNDLTARMVAFVDRVSTGQHFTSTDEAHAVTAEARAIVASLEPVDGDLVEARRIVDSEPSIGADSIRWHGDDHAFVSQLVAQGIKRGRALEREEG